MKTTARAVLINRNHQCLLVQHNEWNPADQGKWSTVGGRVELDESLKSCLERELTEEFGSFIADKFQIGPKIFENRGSDRIDHFFVVWFDGDDVTVEARDEILNHSWFLPDETRQLKLFFGFEADLCAKALLSVQQTLFADQE
jgi:ADP-ribose pyrophosphatase YjhB (NUDIX family)